MAHLDIPAPQELQFREILIGHFAEFCGRRYQKLALSMASDEDRNGSVFMAQVEVQPDPLAGTATGAGTSMSRGTPA